MHHPIRSMIHAWVSVFLFALPLFALEKTRAMNFDNILWTARWNHDGSQFAVGGVRALWIFDSDTFNRKSLLRGALGGNADGSNLPYMAVTHLSWHPSGDFFVVGDYGTEVDDPVLQFWSADGQLFKSIPLEGDTQVRNVSWSPDGMRLASASSKLGIWTMDGELEFEGKSPDLLWGVDWHPNGDKILTSSIEGRVTLWSSIAEVVKEIVLPSESGPLAEPVNAGQPATR